jgi:hypothetical protein
MYVAPLRKAKGFVENPKLGKMQRFTRQRIKSENAASLGKGRGGVENGEGRMPFRHGVFILDESQDFPGRTGSLRNQFSASIPKSGSRSNSR